MDVMTEREVFAAALALEPEVRKELYQLLGASLHDEETSQKEWERRWAQEASRRLNDLREGRAKESPAEEVFARVRASRP